MYVSGADSKSSSAEPLEKTHEDTRAFLVPLLHGFRPSPRSTSRARSGRRARRASRRLGATGGSSARCVPATSRRRACSGSSRRGADARRDSTAAARRGCSASRCRAPGEAEAPPYSLPWQLRSVIPANVVRSDTNFAFYNAPNDGPSGFTVATTLLASYKVTDELAPLVRLGVVSHTAPDTPMNPPDGSSFTNRCWARSTG
jgi:hypothetical protein